MNYLLKTLGMALLAVFSLTATAKTWTYEECLQYALDNNITLKKAGLTRQTQEETTRQSKASLLPSLSFSTSQNISYQPWKANGSTTIQNNEIQMVSSTTSYNGSYNLGANWTVWNGNRNTNQVKLNALAENEAELDSITSARSIEERIAQLFVQILYSKEAVKVNQATLEAAKVNEQRGLEMVKVGTMSKADCSQLTAQRAQDEYSVVQSESNVRDFKRQLKALLQLTDDEEFDVVSSTPTDAMALQPIPSLSSVYEAALENRPEIKRAMLDVESADIQMKLAKGQRMPSISLNAAVSTNNSSMSDNNWGDQIKTNFNAGGGVTISVPIFDQRSSRTAINKANIQKQTALLNIKDKQTTLYSTIENYWIQANNNQNQYKSAKVSTESAQTSYDLLSEQFAVGLKNIVELQTGKTRLLSAQQSELQSKYLTILNRQLLEFYKR
jgi:outer membrane protein